MHIVFFSHPDFFGHQSRSKLSSMPRFLRMLAEGMKDRGHTVDVWSPKSRFFNLPIQGKTKKWLGYIDQHLIFPTEVRSRLKNQTSDTLFVFTDQAQGLWVPLAAARNHVIHCHDFLAQNSALGKISENPTSRSGRYYQNLIYQGYSQGKNFISVSQATRSELHKLLLTKPLRSEVVYNGLDPSFVPGDIIQARESLGASVNLSLSAGYLLHVGGNQWYKNRLGVIDIYDAWRALGSSTLPLLLVGESPVPDLLRRISQSTFSADIYYISNITDALVRSAYVGASVFLFPSLAEGFGWPIAEAMGSGCPTITTGEVPMSEVAGNAGFFIARRPSQASKWSSWAAEAAQVVAKVLALTPEERQQVVEVSIANSRRFNVTATLDQIEEIYQSVLQQNVKA